MPRTKQKPETPSVPVPTSAADFDESTPPPRRRPAGEALGRYVVLPEGESLIGVYLAWDKQGRIPPGSVLLKFLGDATGITKGTHEVIAFADGFNAAPPKKCPLGSAGAIANQQASLAWMPAIHIRCLPDTHAKYTVQVPREDKRHG